MAREGGRGQGQAVRKQICKTHGCHIVCDVHLGIGVFQLLAFITTTQARKSGLFSSNKIPVAEVMATYATKAKAVLKPGAFVAAS